MALNKEKIGFIGGGNMAEALISGLLAKRQIPPSRIVVFDPVPHRQRHLKKQFRVRIAKNNCELVKQVNVIVLAVKPQVIKKVLTEIQPEIKRSHLVISIAAGIDTVLLHRYLGKEAHIIRTMPNTPALIGCGITGLYATAAIRSTDKKRAQAIFSSVGEVIFVNKERDLDWVTALSGSGPAYLFFFLESLTAAGIKGGLKKKVASRLALVTVRGAAALAAQSRHSFKTLRTQVISKGGTTEAALKVLKQRKWGNSLVDAVKAAARRARELRSFS